MEADDKFAQFPDATNKLVGDDGTRYFTDKDGIDYAMPKEWNRQNSYVYESPELHTYFEEILNNTQSDNVRLTDEMREYEPKEMFAVFDSAPPFRLMFMDQSTWTDKERDSVKLFKHWCHDKHLKVPNDDVWILRFLQNKQFDYSKTHAALLERTAMFKEYLPVQITSKVRRTFESGCFYIGGRDRCHRPMLIINARKIFEFQPALEISELIAAQIWLCEMMQDKMMIPGKIENLIMICDMEGCNVFSINYSLLSGIIKFMTNALKGINRTFIIVNAPLTFAMVSKVVNVFLDETTRRKIMLTRDSVVPDDFKDLIHPKMLEKQFGGQAENRETGFWPPRLACDVSELN